MKERLWTVLVAAAVTALGAAAVALRVRSEIGDRPARDESLWRLVYDIRVTTDQAGTKIRASLPESTPVCRVVRESFTHSGLVMDILRDGKTSGRYAAAVALQPTANARLRAAFDVLISPHGASGTTAEQDLSPADRARYLREEPAVQTSNPVVARTLQDLSARDGTASQARLLDQIFTHCWQVIEIGDATSPDDAAGALEKSVAGTLGRARAMVALCRAGRIPARLVCGFAVRAQKDARPHSWVEAHLDNRWLPFDPEFGYRGELPPHYLPVRRDGSAIVRTAGQATLASQFGIYRVLPAADRHLAGRENLLDILDLRQLPVGMQRTLAVLLLLPVGALITSLWRNLVGLQTFGTFSPVLLALSFLYADWRTGLLVFALVMLIGLGGRGLVERLKLLMVPRLSLVLTLVVLCLTLAVSALDYFGLTPSASAVILPLVIMTMMIERFYIRCEEDGAVSSLKMLGNTFIVAATCLILLRWENLGRLALRYPEGELFVVSALLLVGRYSGYRLTELIRFRDASGRTGT